MINCPNCRNGRMQEIPWAVDKLECDLCGRTIVDEAAYSYATINRGDEQNERTVRIQQPCMSEFDLKFLKWAGIAPN